MPPCAGIGAQRRRWYSSGLGTGAFGELANLLDAHSKGLIESPTVMKGRQKPAGHAMDATQQLVAVLRVGVCGCVLCVATVRINIWPGAPVAAQGVITS